MKLLLTSVGATNGSIRRALVELLGKPIGDCRAVQINTALYASPSGPEDAYEMARHYGQMGWKELGTLELTALPSIEEGHWLPFVQSSDAILVSGGNTGYLSYWFEASGFAGKLPGLLEDTVYFGISAGSTMLTPGQNFDPERLRREGVYYDDEYEEAAPKGAGSAWGMGLVEFSIRPHLGADYFPVEVDTAMMERAAAKLDHPLYAIDDETAIKVVDQEVEVVSEGEWRLFNGWRHRQRLGGRLDRAGGPGVSMKDGKDVRVIAVPYDSGHAGIRMGTGPKHLLDNGFGEALRSEGLELGVATVHHEGEPPAEVATAFELHGLVSDRVREAVAGGGFPLVLSGNCNTAAIGAISGVGPEGLGIVWFDAHGEFNTPETTTSGFIDGMGLSIAVGHCWRRMAGDVPGFSPVPEENVVMAWVREVDPTERERLDASSVAVVDAGLIEREGTRELAGALDHLKARVGRVYVHLDLDVLDAGKVGKANEFASEGGPDAEELQAALGMVGERFEVVALGIASYDPSFDTEGKVLRAVTTSVGALTRLTDPSD